MIFTLKRVSKVSTARKMAVTTVSMDGDQEEGLAVLFVSVVVLSLRGSKVGG